MRETERASASISPRTNWQAPRQYGTFQLAGHFQRFLGFYGFGRIHIIQMPFPVEHNWLSNNLIRICIYPLNRFFFGIDLTALQHLFCHLTEESFNENQP